MPVVTAATTGERWNCQPKSPPGTTVTLTKRTMPGFAGLMLIGWSIRTAARPRALIGGSEAADATRALSSYEGLPLGALEPSSS